MPGPLSRCPRFPGYSFIDGARRETRECRACGSRAGVTVPAVPGPFIHSRGTGECRGRARTHGARGSRAAVPTVPGPFIRSFTGRGGRRGSAVATAAVLALHKVTVPGRWVPRPGHKGRLGSQESRECPHRGHGECMFNPTIFSSTLLSWPIKLLAKKHNTKNRL